MKSGTVCRRLKKCWNTEPVAQLDIQVEEGDWEALQDIHVLHSRTEVISFLQRVLPQSGHILRMSTEELPEAVVEILAQFLSRRDICCEHVFSLKKVREQGGSLYNLQYINQIMPLIRSDSEYIPYYDYEGQWPSSKLVYWR